MPFNYPPAADDKSFAAHTDRVVSMTNALLARTRTRTHRGPVLSAANMRTLRGAIADLKALVNEVAAPPGGSSPRTKRDYEHRLAAHGPHPDAPVKAQRLDPNSAEAAEIAERAQASRTSRQLPDPARIRQEHAAARGHVQDMEAELTRRLPGQMYWDPARQRWVAGSR